MPISFTKNEKFWQALVPVPDTWVGECTMDFADNQTGAMLAKFRGRAEDGAARFDIPSLPSGRTVRTIVRHGRIELSGICNFPAPEKDDKPDETESVEIRVPFSSVEAALPGSSIRSLRSRLEDRALSVGSGPLFAVVETKVVGSLKKCLLREINNDNTLVFDCEVAL